MSEEKEKSNWEKMEALRLIESEMMIADRKRRSEIMEEEHKRCAEIHEWNRAKHERMVNDEQDAREARRISKEHLEWDKERLERIDKFNTASCVDQRKQLTRMAVAFEGMLAEIKLLRKNLNGIHGA